MNKGYKNVDPRAMKEVSNLIVSEERIKNRIEVLRKHGYSDDDILLILIEEKCQPDPSINDENVKMKRFIYYK